MATKRKRPPDSGRRPAGPSGEARTYRTLLVRMSETETEDLETRAEQAGQSLSDYARTLLWPRRRS